MELNLNKLFPSLSIKKKLLIAFTMLSFIPLLFLGIVSFYNNLQTMRQIALDSIQNDIVILNERARNFLTNVHTDIDYLRHSPLFSNYLEKISAARHNNRNPDPLLNQELASFLKIKKIYHQIRFVDAHRDECFRILFNSGRVTITPPRELQRSRFAFYFWLTQSLEKGQIAITPVELRAPKNRQTPAINFATRIYNPTGKFMGILIADVFARNFYESFERTGSFEPQRTIGIVSNEGNFLYHSQENRNWNELVAYRSKINLKQVFPEAAAKKITSGKAGIILKNGNFITAYTPLFPANVFGANSYYMYENVNKNFIWASARRFAKIFFSLLVIFVGAAIILGLLATHQLAGPVAELQKEAEIITRGNYTHRLTINTNDEIEELARQFNQMADAIRERELLLAEHQRTLEKTVQERTRELQNEKEKLQAILDNVPSAVLLVDETDRVVSVSAAIQNILNVSPAKILGRAYSELFPDDSLKGAYPRDKILQLKKAQIRMETFTRPDGETIHLEHTIIPLSIQNFQRVTLEILTDITERKKLETHLINMEKLAATGEMAAVIAHEIRNSITSIKMILQLQREAAEKETDRKSLEVAIGSTHRMEEIVKNLLQFAKPAPFEFQKGNLNEVLRECASFMEVHFRKKQIDFQLELDDSVPDSVIDSDHMREVFINMLLNAVQAVPRGGKVRVASRCRDLPKAVEIFPISGSDGDVPERKFILKKGTRVAEIIIEDTGVGVPQEQIEKIFEPFFTTKLTGTGLGLAMARRVISEHHGIIQAKSQKGKGTVFTILLPLRDKL